MTYYESTSGLIRNPFHILDAVDYIGEDAYEEYEEDAKDYTVAKAVGPDQVIMDTGYFEANALLGVHRSSIRFFTASVVTYPIVFEYWFMDPEGNENRVEFNTIFQNDIGDEWGRIIDTSYFHENYQYRIVVRTHSSLGVDEYVWVDYVKLIPTDPSNQKGWITYASSSTPDVPAIPIERSGWETILGDGSTYTYQDTFSIGATPQLTHITVTAYSTLGIVANIHSFSATKFTVRAWRTNEINWSGNIGVFWKATCWQTITSLK